MRCSPKPDRRLSAVFQLGQHTLRWPACSFRCRIVHVAAVADRLPDISPGVLVEESFRIPSNSCFAALHSVRKTSESKSRRSAAAGVAFSTLAGAIPRIQDSRTNPCATPDMRSPSRGVSRNDDAGRLPFYHRATHLAETRCSLRRARAFESDSEESSTNASLPSTVAV